MKARVLLAGLIAAVIAHTAAAAPLDSILEQLRRSDFVFGRLDNNSPFPPAAWVAVQDHGDSELTLDGTTVEFSEYSATEFLLAPLWIGQKDMILAGEWGSWQRVTFNTPVSAKRDLYTAVPLLAWARQTKPNRQVAAFVAPQYSHGSDYTGHEFTDWSGYAGLVWMNWSNDRIAWIYGGIGYAANDDLLLIPYLGALWQPTPRWSVSAILPWPSVTYAPSRNYMFQLGLSPADATLASTDDEHLRVSYTSWNLLFSAHRKLVGNLWLSGSVGMAGAGDFAVNTGDNENNYKLRRDLVWTLQFAFRPPTQGPGKKP